MANTTCEIVWTLGLCKDIGANVSIPVVLHCDNKAAMHIAANPIYYERTKHIEIDCFVVRDNIKNEIISTSYVPTNHGRRIHQNIGKPSAYLSYFQAWCSKPTQDLKGSVECHC